MGLYDDYCAHVREFKALYGEHTVVLYEVGSFFELYNCDENLGADYQLSVVQDADGSWRVDRALRRGLCGRGASGDVCV